MVFSRQAQEHASSQIRHVDVFQRIGVSRQRAALKAYAGSDAWSSMKVRRHQNCVDQGTDKLYSIEVIQACNLTLAGRRARAPAPQTNAPGPLLICCGRIM
jgi:hypothetical protein